MSNFSVGVNYTNQVGQVYFDDDWSESDLWVACVPKYETGTVVWQLVDHKGMVLYEREVFNTPEWKAQALDDILQEAKQESPTGKAVVELMELDED